MQASWGLIVFLATALMTSPEVVARSNTPEEDAAQERRREILERRIDWEAKLTASQAEKEKIPSFELRRATAEVRLDRDQSQTKLFARIRGRVNSKEWNLSYRKEWLVKAGDSDRDFETEVLLTDQVTPILFQGFDIAGRYVEQKVEVEFGNWTHFEKQILEERRVAQEQKEQQDAEEVARAAEQKRVEVQRAQESALWEKRVSEMKRFYFTPFLGVSHVSYDETFEAPVSYAAVTPQASLQFLAAPPWLVFQLSGFIQALPVGSTRPDVAVRFAGVDLLAGVALPFGSSGLRLNLLAGGYYKTMFVEPPTLGFRNLLGPALYPMLDLELPRGWSIALFGKYSPVVGGSGFLPLASREWVVGGSLTPMIAGKHQIPIQFEYSWIDLSLSNKTLVGRTMTLSVGYAF